MFIRRLLAIVLAMLIHQLAWAQWQAGMAYDQNFGAEVPVLDASHPDMGVIGFVQLPLSGGYVFFSVQQIGTAKKLVMTRFNSDGSLDKFWARGTYASLASYVIGIVLPDESFSTDESQYQARLTTAIEGSPATEKIYLAAKYTVGGAQYLYVAKFDLTEPLESFAISNLPTSFSDGAGAMIGVSTQITRTAGTPGVVALVQGIGSESTKASVVQAYGDPTTIDIAEVLTFTRPTLRLNRLIARPDGLGEVVGTSGSQALYMKLDVSRSAIVSETSFDLPCPSGFTISSVIDNLTLIPPADSDADVLILGRVECSDGLYSEVARVANIATLPTIESFTAQKQGLEPCPPPFASAGCLYSSFLRTADTSPFTAFATTTLTSLAHVATTAPIKLLGNDFNQLNGPVFPATLLSEEYGTYFTYPYVVGVDFDASSGNVKGLARLALDRIFAAGSEVP